MEQPKILLKQVSNTTLLDMYYDYRKSCERDDEMLSRNNNDKKVVEYYSYKKIENYEYLTQIKLEILSRMMGMDID